MKKVLFGILSLALAVLLQVELSAQRQWVGDLKVFQDDEDEWDEEDNYRGFSINLNLGTYLASKKSANFYNGSCTYNISDVQATCNTIEERLFLGQTAQQVQNQLNINSFTIPFDSSPLNMRYNPGLMVGATVKFNFNDASAIVSEVNVARLKTVDVFTLRTDLLPDGGQGSEDIRVFTIAGEEARMSITLGYRTAALINDGFYWYFGAGGSFNSLRMDDNYLEIEGQRYDLWVGFVGPNNFNGPVGNLTSFGWGAYGETGIQAYMNELYEISLGFKLIRDDITMGTYNAKLFNKMLYVSFGI